MKRKFVKVMFFGALRQDQVKQSCQAWGDLQTAINAAKVHCRTVEQIADLQTNWRIRIQIKDFGSENYWIWRGQIVQRLLIRQRSDQLTKDLATAKKGFRSTEERSSSLLMV